MKVVVTSEGTTPDSLVDSRFGRGQYFLIFDTEAGVWEPLVIQNDAARAAEEAGILAAQTVIRTGAKAMIASHCGPKAFAALERGGVEVYLAGGKTATEAAEALKAGELQALTTPDLCSVAGRPGNNPN